MEDIVWFSEVNKNDTPLVGGKGANLGELYSLDIPIPNGFIVTSEAYFKNIKESGADVRIKGILYGLDVENPTQLETKANLCQEEIKKIKIDSTLDKKITTYYQKLGGSKELVAVRSSATAEDLPEASFAGQQSTFLNISGVSDLKEAILAAWASLFEARAIYYRVQKNFDHFKVGIAIPVQKMIQSQTSGIMFTLDPITNSKKVVTIEAIYGLGELIVSGQVTPDHYEVEKEGFKISSKNIVSQNKMMVKSKKGSKIVDVSKAYRQTQKLPDEKIIELARLGHKIEKHYFWPQDIEWGYQDGQLYILQTRPVTTIKSAPKLVSQKEEAKETPILQGSPASPGLATGKVAIIKSPKEMSKVEKGDVLVTEMTNPDYVPVMRKACAIVTDKGGRTSHAAIVSRELGTPCVVGTEEATKKLKDGMIVTVDGTNGLIYKGKSLNKKDQILQKKSDEKIYKTATHIYVNLAEPDLANKIASKNVDGVGLLRAEFLLAQIGKHPKKFLEEKNSEEFIEKLSSGLKTFAKAFGSRPVVYRASDFKSNEYRNLKGGDKFEPVEPNPMLGYRGAFRYIKDPDIFKMELEAIKRVRKLYSNLHLMIPFVRNVNEFVNVKDIVDSAGLTSDPKFKLWMMAEIPVNAILLEDFIEAGVQGVSIGSNDLTMLVLGTDRDNEEVASEFNELNPAVMWFLEKIVKTCAKNNITCSICGQAPSIYPDLTEKLVSWGITSISVNPDVIESTRKIVYEAEKKLVGAK